MAEKLKITLIIFAVCLVGTGVFYFSNTWRGDEILKEDKTQTVQNLKLLTSHSAPQVGEQWVVSFETTGEANLTITPKDQDTIGDLDLISLKCGDEIRSPQILGNDVIFYSGWQCADRGELTHLVNIARKHTLEFQFGDGMAYAYNNPDSITDTFNNTNYIFSTSNITVDTVAGQVKLSTCGDIGDECSVDGDCCSSPCVDGYCCNSACSGNCDRCNVGGSLGTCTNVNSDCAGTGASCYCSSGSCQACSNTGASCNCSGYACQACSNTVSSCNCSAYTCQACPDTYGLCGEPTCSSYTCGNTPYSNSTDCGLCVKCNGSGSCSNYYTVGTIDSTAPGLCNNTHYRCSGNGYCTAPCNAIISCMGLEDPYTKCSDYCGWTGGACCGCLSAWSTSNCTGTQYTCSTSYRAYCRGYGWQY